MKQCLDCNAIYEDGLDLCPTCGVLLERYESGNREHASPSRSTSRNDMWMSGTTGSASDAEYTFMQQSGRDILINGAVAETSSQQYYQSKLTKLFRSLFSGEPYQLSHTSFMTIFRVEEHSYTLYPEQASDIVLYGNVLNLFAPGDDVTVTARRKGSRLIARRIYNHSINRTVSVQPNIPSVIIRIVFLSLIFVLYSLIYRIIRTDFSVFGDRITALLASFLPVIIVVAMLWNGIKSFFKRGNKKGK